MGQEAEFQAGAAADVVDEGGAEDGEAGSTRAADAGVDDAVRAAGEQAVGEVLGAEVAAGDGVWAEVSGEGAFLPMGRGDEGFRGGPSPLRGGLEGGCGRGGGAARRFGGGPAHVLKGRTWGTRVDGDARVWDAKVVEGAGDVGEVVVGGGDLFVGPLDLFEGAELVEGDLGNGGLAIEGGVPGTAGGRVEAAAGGGGVGEGGVDDVGVADAVDEFVDADAGE